MGVSVGADPSANASGKSGDRVDLRTRFDCRVVVMGGSRSVCLQDDALTLPRRAAKEDLMRRLMLDFLACAANSNCFFLSRGGRAASTESGLHPRRRASIFAETNLNPSGKVSIADGAVETALRSEAGVVADIGIGRRSGGNDAEETMEAGWAV